MIVAAVSLGSESIGMAVLERIYPDEIRKLFVDFIRAEDAEADHAWYARAFSWTASILRQHKPVSILVESAGGRPSSSIRGVALAAASQQGGIVVAYETFENALRSIGRVSDKPKLHVKYRLKLRGRIRSEVFRACALSTGHLLLADKERLKKEAFEFERETRAIAREVAR